MAATDEGEIEVKVAIEFDTSGFNDTLNEVFNEFRDTVIDLEVKAETAAATEEIERLQEKCDDLEYKIEEIEGLYQNKMIGLADAFNQVKESVESLNDAIKNTGDATSIEGIEDTINQLDTLGNKIDDSQVELAKLSKQDNAGFEKIAKDADKAGKAAGEAAAEFKDLGEKGAAAAEQVTKGQQDIGKAVEEITKKVEGEVAAFTEAGKALSASYKTENMDQALDQLRENFSRYQTEIVNGDVKPASEAGTRIGYAYVQSILEAVEKKAPAKEIRKYLIGDFKLPKGAKLADYFAEPDNKYTSSLLKMGKDLANFANLYGQAFVSLNGAPLSEEIKNQIEQIVQAQRDLVKAESAIPESQRAMREHPKNKTEREAPLTDQEKEAEKARMAVMLLKKEFRETLTAEADLAAANNGLDDVAKQAEEASSSVENLEGDLKNVGQQATDTAAQVTEGQEQQSQAIEKTAAQAKSLQEILGNIQTGSIRELAERDFSTGNIPEARDQLKEAYSALTTYEKQYGANPYSLQGAEDGYAYIQALKEAINKGTSIDLLAPNLYKGLGIDKNQLTTEYLNTENNAIDAALKKYEAFLVDYEQLTQKVSQATNGAKISRDVRQQIEEITSLQAKLREAQANPKLFDNSKKLQSDLDAANQKLESTLGVSLKEIGQTAQATTENVQETAKASEQVGEAATEASNKVVEGKRAETQATQEATAALEAEGEAVNQIKGLASAQEALNTDFTGGNKNDARSRLATASKNYKSLFGNEYDLEKVMATEEGAVVGYAFAEAYKNAVDKDLNGSVIENYFIPGLTAKSTKRLKSSIAEGSNIDELIKATEPIVKQSAAVYAETAQAAGEASEKVGEAAQAQSEMGEKSQQAASGAEQTAQAEKSVAEGAEQAAQSTEKMAEATQKLGEGEVGVQAETMTEFANTITEATSKLTELVSKMEEVGEASSKAMTSDDAAQQERSIDNLITSLSNAGDKLDTLGKKLGELTEEARKFSEAGIVSSEAETKAAEEVTEAKQKEVEAEQSLGESGVDAQTQAMTEFSNTIVETTSKLIALVDEIDKITEVSAKAMTSDDVAQQEQAINGLITSLGNVGDKIDALGKKMGALTEEAQKFSEAGNLSNIINSAKQGESALQEELESAEELNKTLEQIPESPQQVSEEAKETVANLQEEQKVNEEVTQAVTAAGEVAVDVENQKQAEIEETNQAYKQQGKLAEKTAKQAGNWAQELLDKDFNRANKSASHRQLNQNFQQLTNIKNQADDFGKINGVNWLNTKEGASAAYAAGQSWIDSFNKGRYDKLLSTQFDNDLWGNTKVISSSGHMLDENIEGVKAATAQAEQILVDYANLYDQVISQLNGQPITPELENQITNIVNVHAMLKGAQESMDTAMQNGWDTDKEQQFISEYSKIANDLEAELQRMVEAETGITSTTNEVNKEISSGTQQIQSSAAEAAEDLNQVSEAEESLLAINIIPDAEGIQKISDNAHTAAESVEELETNEESLLAINIIPPGEAFEDIGEKAESAATSVEKVANAEEQLVATDTSSEATELQQIGEAAEASDKPVEELKEDIQELSNTSIEPSVPTETVTKTPQQQEDTGLKQRKKEIDEISEAYNNLTKYEKQYRELSAINPADMNASQKKQWNSISVQYENAQKVIASLSKETQLTEKQTQAQDKYNKKKKELDQIEQRTIETNQIAADTLAERQKQQEEAAEAERAAAEAEEKAIQEQIERLQEHINKIYEEAEAERVRAQAAQEAADAEKAALEAYQVLEKNELQHQKNQTLIDTGVPLNQNQRRIEDQYAAAKKVIEDTKVSTEALTKAEEHYQQTVADTKAIQAYQTLAKDIQTYTELTNKVSMGNDLTFRQQGQLQNLTNEMKQAWNVVKDYQAVTNEAVAAQSAWENKLASSQQTTADFVASLGDSIGAYKSLAEAQKRVNEVFSTGKGGQLKWSGDQQAAGTAKWGNELQKVQYTIRQVGNEQYQVYESIQSSQAATSTWGNLVNQVSKRFSSLVAYLSTFVSFYRILGAAKSGINTVTELNTQLTEMRKVSDESTESLKRYQDQTFAVAKEVGTTAAQIQSSTADYLRLGKSLEEAAELAKNTSILMSVSEFENINDATEAMISMTQAFKEMSSMEIIDELNKIGELYKKYAENYSNIVQYAQ